MEEHVKPLRKITTYNRYKELIQKYISKTIGTMNMTDIQSFHIEQLLLNIKKENKNIWSNITIYLYYFKYYYEQSIKTQNNQR